jgi:hypothetical protein
MLNISTANHAANIPMANHAANLLYKLKVSTARDTKQ